MSILHTRRHSVCVSTVSYKIFLCFLCVWPVSRQSTFRVHPFVRCLSAVSEVITDKVHKNQCQPLHCCLFPLQLNITWEQNKIHVYFSKMTAWNIFTQTRNIFLLFFSSFLAVLHWFDLILPSIASSESIFSRAEQLTNHIDWLLPLLVNRSRVL